MEEKVLKYEAFVNETLKEQLRTVLARRDNICRQASEYLQLKSLIEKLKEDGAEKKVLKTKIDLGCNFYVQADVPDASKMFVSVGQGLFVEFTYDEALRFIHKKSALLMEQTEELTMTASLIRAHIKLVLEGLRELQNISSVTEREQRELF